MRRVTVNQDRPQPQPRGFHGRGPAVAAPVLELLSELDDQDRILRCKKIRTMKPDLVRIVVVPVRAEARRDRGQ